MSFIYVPKGRAREYSPLALNIYNSCDHYCDYCYIKKMKERFKIDTGLKVEGRKGILEWLKKNAHKYSDGEQVLLCFSGDPYCRMDEEIGLTREVLKILLENDVKTAILTKGGSRCLRDLDLFKKFKNIKVGATLTLINKDDSQEYEPAAAEPMSRTKTLKRLHDEGIMTWVSLEPIIDPIQTLTLIKETHEYVDHYKIGLINHYKLDKDIDYKMLVGDIIKLLREKNKKFYIKESLTDYINEKLVTKEERNQDYLNL